MPRCFAFSPTFARPSPPCPARCPPSPSYPTPSSLRYHKRTEAHTGLACAHLGTGADNGDFFSPKIHSPLWTRMHAVAASSRHATSAALPHASHHLSPEEGISVSWKFPGKREVPFVQAKRLLARTFPQPSFEHVGSLKSRLKIPTPEGNT